MKEKFRIYYYFLIGAIGGLTGWFLSSLMSSGIGEINILDEQSVVKKILFGAAIGAIIGIAVSAYDGISNRSFARFLKFGTLGFFLGATAGALALPLTELIYDSLISALGNNAASPAAMVGKFFIGTFCWVLFGALIGLGEGIGKGTQVWKGILGGMLGGLVGGMVYEINRAVRGTVTEPGAGNFWQTFFLAISFTLLGAAVSAAVALVTSALKSAWIEVVDGKLSGRNYDVTKYVDPKLGAFRSGIIGSDEWSAHIYLPGDNEILSQHAEINYTAGAPTITVKPEAAKRQVTYLNGRRLAHSSPLMNGDRLQIGSTNLIYRNKK